ncbi:hypothetical protein D6C78_04034 [Aureobasidium pullulans]|uniref:BTB domain-containing protein n=1 Tax=Aureobasidium pullulans TaxID=5580 RepID=A0A4V4LF30_AURPU|nr:hypothetical protein D6C78_04034 [Aureobasidium pullulans]
MNFSISSASMFARVSEVMLEWMLSQGRDNRQHTTWTNPLAIMATMNTNAATATTTTVTPVTVVAGPNHVSDSDADVQQNKKTKARPLKKPTNRKCCFNEPGGPWPRNILLQAATCTDMKDKLMTLVVGAEETHFTWFHEVLSFHSPFFAGAIKYSCYDESKNNTVRMPEDSPDVVREVGGYGLGSDNPSIDPWTYWDLMVDIYIFGNKYGIPRLQNVAINEMISLFTDQFAFPRAATIDKVYELTPSGVSLRKLITDIVVLSHDNVEALIDGQSRFGEGFHPDFITDLVKRLYRAAIDDKAFKEQRLERSQWGQVRRCMYHVSEVAARSNGQRVGQHS